MLPKIEKAIFDANIGVTPNNDGNVIRIPFPALTEDKRKDLVKEVKKIGEDTKVAIRNIRREQNDKVKKGEKDKVVSEDESKKYQTEIQTITDNFTKEVDKLIASKEKELMTV
jgi:ribosome recycling factor